MAVDTLSKRSAAIRFGSMHLAGTRPPSGDVSVFERSGLLAAYFIEPVASEVGSPSDGWTFGYPQCIASENFVCKHVRSTKTFYVDLGFLPVGVTVVSATADTDDADLIVDGVEVLSEDTTVDPSQGCAGSQLEADRALLVQLSGGIDSDDEVVVTVGWVQSDGTEDFRDVRVIVGGTE